MKRGNARREVAEVVDLYPELPELKLEVDEVGEAIALEQRAVGKDDELAAVVGTDS